jgi:hypothetical protein
MTVASRGEDETMEVWWGERETRFREPHVPLGGTYERQDFEDWTVRKISDATISHAASTLRRLHSPLFPRTTNIPAKDAMTPRASSPALSENEFDIADALFGGGDIDGPQSSHDLGVDLDLGGDDGSDDEAFIAARQAAANRKSSNLKGKTVKKGGGFQAMGLNAALLKAITRKGFSIPTPIQ